jgi:hypothetical protein
MSNYLNIPTLDQSIALVASIGACLSAIATFWTVRQIAKQREASYRPELVFSRTFFDASPDPIRDGSLPERWVNSRTQAESQEPLRDLSVSLHNVGLGAAKNVTILWSFPLEETVERVNRDAQRTLTPAFFSSDATGMTIKSETLGNGTSIWENQRRVSVDFVLPASVQKEPFAVTLPHVYVQLCSALLFLACKTGDSKNSLEVPSLSASIEYIDIGNRIRRSFFEFELHVVAIVGDGKNFSGYIDCRNRA